MLKTTSVLVLLNYLSITIINSQLGFGLNSDVNKFFAQSQFFFGQHKGRGVLLSIEGGYYGRINYVEKSISDPYSYLLYDTNPYGAYTDYKSSSNFIGCGLGIGFYNDFEINFGYLKLVGSLNYLYIQDEFKNQIREFSIDEIHIYPDKTVNFSTFYSNIGLFHYFKINKKSNFELFYGLNMMFYIPKRNLIYSPDDGRNLLVGLEPNLSIGIKFNKKKRMYTGAYI